MGLLSELKKGGKKEISKYLVKGQLLSVKRTRLGDVLVNLEYSRKERRPIQSEVL
jgi:hypothetical protein